MKKRSEETTPGAWTGERAAQGPNLVSIGLRLLSIGPLLILVLLVVVISL